jgi:hypothetical protein
MGGIRLKKISKLLLVFTLSLTLIGTLGSANDGDAAVPHTVIGLD